MLPFVFDLQALYLIAHLTARLQALRSSSLPRSSQALITTREL